MKTLEELRDEIDRIDDELISLFEKRMNVVMEVAEYKYKNNLPVLNSVREQAVLERGCNRLKNQELSESLMEWMKNTMTLSRHEQEKYLNKISMMKIKS